MGTETTVVSTTVESEDLLYTIEGEDEDLIEADTAVEITTETTVVSTTVESEDLLYTIEGEDEDLIEADIAVEVEQEPEDLLYTIEGEEDLIKAETPVEITT